MGVMKLVTLCYHKVGSEAAEGRRLNVHPTRLDSHVRFFIRRGYRFVKGGDLTRWPIERTVCFTFDDGFISTIENGMPVFDRHKVPMSIYAVSSLVGKTSEWEGELARPLADWDKLREVQGAGHEVGNHTASHPFLDKLDMDEQAAEILACHSALRENGLRTDSFCFPYGRLNDDSVKALQSCGYKVGLALGKRLPNEGDPFIEIPRIVVAYGDAIPLLLYKLYLRPLLK
jgi:peptidoglycan/xylan/chitin deacetylase (PgdA/CDA1 family)